MSVRGPMSTQFASAVPAVPPTGTYSRATKQDQASTVDEAHPVEAEYSVVLAEDHPFIRAGVQALLAPHPAFSVVAETDTVSSTIAAVRRHRPAVLVLDLGLSGELSLAAISEILRDVPHTRVVVLTMHAEAGYVRAALEAGALGYVLKEAAAEELVSALLAAVRGERYVQPALAAKLVTPTPLRRDVLSDGERRVVDLLAQGHTNQQVADLLHCSLRTVEAHRARAKDKLGITSRADLISYGREQQPQ